MVDDPTDEQEARGLGLWLASLPVILLTVAARGAALSPLWGWFVVPLGAPHMGWLDAAGLSLVATVLVNRVGAPDDRPLTYRALGVRLGVTVVGLALAVALGALVAVAR